MQDKIEIEVFVGSFIMDQRQVAGALLSEYLEGMITGYRITKKR